MPIEIKAGDATSAKPTGNKGIVLGHVCNVQGGWGRGFVLALDGLSPVPKSAYKSLASTIKKGETIPIGTLQWVEIDKNLFVSNMCVQNGIGGTHDKIDYDALTSCLRETFTRAIRLQYDVHMPSGMGSGLAGGNKQKIHEIIRQAAKEVEELEFSQLSITLWEFEDKSAVPFVS